MDNFDSCKYTAIHVAQAALRDVRLWGLGMAEYNEGRVRAAAVIYPCIETLSARNEVVFLKGDYAKRHGRFL